MKVLLLVPDLVVGGVTTIVGNLVKHLKVRNYQVVVVSIFDKPADILEPNVKTLGVKNILDLPQAIFKLRKIILNENPDVVHSHTIFSHLLVSIIKKFFVNNIKLICTEHGTLSKSESQTHYMKIFKKINHVVDLMTFVSSASLRSYEKYNIINNNLKSQVVYNGIDTKKFEENNEIRNFMRSQYSIDEETTVYGSLGRLAPEKNIELFLKALVRLKGRVKFKFFLIGNGTEKDNILSAVKELNLTNELIYIPFTDKIADYMNAIDILCLSSTTEGLPTVIIEAMSCKKMVVATEVGGVVEILPEGQRFLVKSGDEIDLSNQLIKVSLLGNKSQLGNLYHQIAVEKFSVNVMLEQWIQVYEQSCFKH